jgi:hypothetical protein
MAPPNDNPSLLPLGKVKIQKRAAGIVVLVVFCLGAILRVLPDIPEQMRFWVLIPCFVILGGAIVLCYTLGRRTKKIEDDQIDIQNLTAALRSARTQNKKLRLDHDEKMRQARATLTEIVNDLLLEIRRSGTPADIALAEKLDDMEYKLRGILK